MTPTPCKPDPPTAPDRLRNLLASSWNVVLLGAVLLGGDLAIRSVHAQPGSGPPKVLSAQEFRLVDKEGKTRASLAVDADGTTGLSLLDGTGKRRAQFGLAGATGDASVFLYSGDGALRVRLTALPDGSAGLVFQDKTEKLRAAFRIRSDGSAALSLHDADGKNRAALETLPDGGASISLTNKEGKGGIGGAVLPDGKAGMSVTDKDGETLWSAP